MKIFTISELPLIVAFIIMNASVIWIWIFAQSHFTQMGDYLGFGVTILFVGVIDLMVLGFLRHDLGRNRNAS